MTWWLWGFRWLGICAALHVQETPMKRCVDGRGFVDCDFDLAACARGAGNTTGQKWAIVLAHDLSSPFEYSAENMKSMTDIKERYDNIDVVLIVPGLGADEQNRSLVQRGAVAENATRLGARLLEISPEGLVPPKWQDEHKYTYHPLSADDAGRIRDAGVKIAKSAFAAPPGINQEFDVLQNPLYDMMKINAFALEGYDAVVFYNNEVQLTGRGDITQLFKCASRNYFLSTAGPLTNLNAGFMAFRPSVKLATAMANFAENNTFDAKTGWAGLGYAPMLETGPEQQVFYYTFFYKQSPVIDRALGEVGATLPKATQLDRCVWNYLTHWGCKYDGWSCDDVVAIQHQSDLCAKVGPDAGGGGG